MACSLRFAVSTRIVWLFGVDVYPAGKHSVSFSSCVALLLLLLLSHGFA
jgi:hypothetical protein